MRYWCGRSDLVRTEISASSAQIPWKTSWFDQRTDISQDHSTFHITVGLADHRNYQEEWRVHSIVYRLSTGNQLTRLMLYPIPLISELLEDMDRAMWSWSLDMASGFWVVEMTEWARIFSAFITPSGLYEWLRMTFGLKNAPQIYQRLVDNALFGADPDVSSMESSKWVDVFTEG